MDSKVVGQISKIVLVSSGPRILSMICIKENALVGIRTPDLMVRSHALYPTELPVRKVSRLSHTFELKAISRTQLKGCKNQKMKMKSSQKNRSFFQILIIIYFAFKQNVGLKQMPILAYALVLFPKLAEALYQERSFFYFQGPVSRVL